MSASLYNKLHKYFEEFLSLSADPVWSTIFGGGKHNAAMQIRALKQNFRQCRIRKYTILYLQYQTTPRNPVVSAVQTYICRR
jgi:hypothetical protein